MKRILFLSLLCAASLSAELPGVKTTGTKASVDPNLGRPRDQLQQPLLAPTAPASSSAPISVSGSSVYTHPGIVVPQSGRWIGSDHLLNLGRNIEIVVEIIKPDGVKLPFDEASIKARVDEIFKKHDFNGPNAPSNATTFSQEVNQVPGIPFFNIVLVVYPIDQGFAAYIEGRLMESVDPIRVRLEKDSFFQAVTWEKKLLIVAPTDEFSATVEKSIDDITSVFFDRYDFFEKLRLQMENKSSTQRYR